MRRSDHPNRPSAITCCFLSSLKTLLTLTQGNSRVRINVLDQTFVGRFSSDNHWPHLSDYRGFVNPASLPDLSSTLSTIPLAKSSVPSFFRFQRMSDAQPFSRAVP